MDSNGHRSDPNISIERNELGQLHVRAMHPDGEDSSRANEIYNLRNKMMVRLITGIVGYLIAINLVYPAKLHLILKMYVEANGFILVDLISVFREHDEIIHNIITTTENYTY